MKFFFNILLIALTTSMLFGCSEDYSLSLVGRWQAAELKEEGKPIEVELDKIRFTFFDDQTYTYNSTLNYREAGRYELKSKYLYTTDTLNRVSIEKVVEVVHLTTDTMVIRMEDDNKERLLTLAKEKEQSPSN